MKVHELIKVLQECDPSWEVKAVGCDCVKDVTKILTGTDAILYGKKECLAFDWCLKEQPTVLIV